MLTWPVCSKTNVERNSTSAFHVNVNVTSWSESTCRHALSALKQKLKETAIELCMSISYLWWEFMYLVLSHAQDLWPAIPSPNLCVMPQVSPPSNPIWKRSSSKSICTDDFHSQTHKGVEQSWQFPVYLYILCSACARVIVLTCCFTFTVLLTYLKNLQCLGCY